MVYYTSSTRSYLRELINKRLPKKFHPGKHIYKISSTKDLREQTYENKPTEIRLRNPPTRTHLRRFTYKNIPTRTHLRNLTYEISPRNAHLQKLIREITPKRKNLREHTKKNKPIRTQQGKHIYEYSSTRYHLREKV